MCVFCALAIITWVQALHRKMQPFLQCVAPVVTLPDGMPLCDACGKMLRKEQQEESPGLFVKSYSVPPYIQQAISKAL